MVFFKFGPKDPSIFLKLDEENGRIPGVLDNFYIYGYEGSMAGNIAGGDLPCV